MSSPSPSNCSRPLPIYGTDIDKHPAELVEEVRNELSQLRGKLGDIHAAYPVWKGWLEYTEGGITCLLVALADSRKEMERHREKWGHKHPWVSGENETSAATGGERSENE